MVEPDELIRPETATVLRMKCPEVWNNDGSHPQTFLSITRSSLH